MASKGTPTELVNTWSNKFTRVAPIMVTDGRTDSRKFRILLQRVRKAREHSHVRRVAVECGSLSHISFNYLRLY